MPATTGPRPFPGGHDGGAGHDGGMTATVMRTWTGVIRTADRDEYRAYLERTGLADYRATPGNEGAWIAYRDLGDGRTEVVTVSLWESRSAIEAFAGSDIGVARFYPEDDAFLLERELTVRHFDVV
jgi:heme-degrading monooxygenase HmoA